MHGRRRCGAGFEGDVVEVTIQLLEYAIPTAAAAPTAPAPPKSPWLTHYPITDAWVTQPERPKGAKDKV